MAHTRDPEVIAPGSRDAPRGGMSEGQARSALSNWITNPGEVDPFATMPAFGDTLTPEEMTALVDYLAQRE
jgi:mono/diheme cytochrome c family protein